ncbi:hypothetical protein BJ508DRAFT_374244 [Ascobolus immersus RN42]|uniref:Uncharacterized protein n=1 Tax=Ascobolus immersus RN42 TaxID=1160509 RepID=A0A3N4IEP1_ASCIM|nr:hypothetical protein BJ508DRAFT_374244 [Ascobolus immersus RN42]
MPFFPNLPTFALPSIFQTEPRFEIRPDKSTMARRKGRPFHPRETFRGAILISPEDTYMDCKVSVSFSACLVYSKAEKEDDEPPRDAEENLKTHSITAFVKKAHLYSGKLEKGKQKEIRFSLHFPEYNLPPTCNTGSIKFQYTLKGELEVATSASGMNDIPIKETEPYEIAFMPSVLCPLVPVREREAEEVTRKNIQKTVNNGTTLNHAAALLDTRIRVKRQNVTSQVSLSSSGTPFSVIKEAALAALTIGSSEETAVCSASLERKLIVERSDGHVADEGSLRSSKEIVSEAIPLNLRLYEPTSYDRKYSDITKFLPTKEYLLPSGEYPIGDGNHTIVVGYSLELVFQRLLGNGKAEKEHKNSVPYKNTAKLPIRLGYEYHGYAGGGKEMGDNDEFLFNLEPPSTDANLNAAEIQTAEAKGWSFPALPSQEEEMKRLLEQTWITVLNSNEN